jgi:hypothetical protein
LVENFTIRKGFIELLKGIFKKQRKKRHAGSKIGQKAKCFAIQISNKIPTGTKKLNSSFSTHSLFKTTTKLVLPNASPMP